MPSRNRRLQNIRGWSGLIPLFHFSYSTDASFYWILNTWIQNIMVRWIFFITPRFSHPYYEIQSEKTIMEYVISFRVGVPFALQGDYKFICLFYPIKMEKILPLSHNNRFNCYFCLPTMFNISLIFHFHFFL